MILPLVTCVIPTCDRPLLLMRAIKSVLSQTYKQMEVIVVDDSKNDETQRVLKNLALPVRYIRNSIKRGAPYSRNIGIMEAKGEIITFLDDDDAWMPEKTLLQLKLIEHFPIVTCNFSQTGWLKKRCIRPASISYRMMLYWNYIGSCSFVMTKTNMARECLFDDHLVVGQDWDMWLSLMSKYSIEEAVSCPEFLVEYNIGDHQKITYIDYSKKIPMLLDIYEKYRDDHDEWTTRMFSLRNIVWHGQPFLIKLCLSYVIARMENISFFKWAGKLIQGVFGRLVE